MDFCRQTFRPLAFVSLLALVSTPALAHYKQNQIELILGINHSSHTNNHFHGGADNTEIDAFHDTDTGNDFVGGVGYAYNILPWFKGQDHAVVQRVWVGLDLLFMNTTESGDMYLGQDPAFDFYDFELKEKTSRLMANAEVDFNFPWKNFFPFVQASIGAARVAVSFEDQPKPGVGFSAEKASLSEEINYNLVYSLGAGFKFLVVPEFQMGMSYLYTDFGVVETQTESSTLVLYEPITDHLYTNSVLFNFSYLF
jgi:opacity protein-like surface antigen